MKVSFSIGRCYRCAAPGGPGVSGSSGVGISPGGPYLLCVVTAVVLCLLVTIVTSTGDTGQQRTRSNGGGRGSNTGNESKNSGGGGGGGGGRGGRGGGGGGGGGGGNDIMLDLDKLAELGDKDKLLSMLKEIANSIHKCGVREVPALRRNFITNRTVTCNDGSPAGYYLRRSFGSFKWIIFLEDGWYCFDKHSCQSRWVTMKPYMSSKHWPEVKKGSGITSWDPEENPYYYHANMVYIPYCSSDSWTGTYKATSKEDFSFMGSLIIEEVLKDLLAHGLAKGKKLILAGSSAGGTGVLLNLDRVADNLADWVPGIEVRGVSDSGWFLDNKQYKPAPCMNAHSCAPIDGIKRGVDLWNGRLPRRCADRYAESEKWRCYFGYRLYPTLKTPVYIVQFMFDVAQLTADNVGPPVHKEQWQYIHQLGLDIKESLKNVSAVFAPACMSHIMLMKRDWNQVTVGQVTLPQSIYCWESSSTSQRKGYKCRGGSGKRRHRRKQMTTSQPSSV
ncbi:palmitoleoyl-protein carboxylesterase notum1-like, partial [Octopus sinensis]|uniref:Palmitoleoyl-protein carboxylesterase notum1-like n=1 Tax=Octopus sinensis TaxID=2607531 RepID=A0A7E6EJN9_9MOLL